MDCKGMEQCSNQNSIPKNPEADSTWTLKTLGVGSGVMERIENPLLTGHIHSVLFVVIGKTFVYNSVIIYGIMISMKNVSQNGTKWSSYLLTRSLYRP